MSLPRQRPFSSDNRTGSPASWPRRAPSQQRARRNLLLDMPIAWRLALGFVVAALVAALAAGLVGIQRAQSLSKQTDFYHHLLQVNTSLTTGRSFLELIHSELQQTLEDASVAQPSQETLDSDKKAITNLSMLYTETLNTYQQSDLLEQHADQLALLQEAGESSLTIEQVALLNSAQRTWQVYQVTQQQILDDLSSNNVSDAQILLQEQGEPTSADALSALHSLIQLDDSLASAVDTATNVETYNQLLTTLIATVCAFFTIVLIGWFISETLVRRLRDLRRVTRSVEEGRVNERVAVVGRDEIAQVSLAVNAMIATITGLLEETRQQRDALAGAAEHLFSDMRIVNAGDLRVSATVSNDPIGMLANAFNFTVGRFRRFVLHTRTTIEQLDVLSRQNQERSTGFLSLVRAQLRDTHVQAEEANAPFKKTPVSSALHQNAFRTATQEDASPTTQQIRQTQDALLPHLRNDLMAYLNTTRETVEKANRSLSRLSKLTATAPRSSSPQQIESQVQAQIQECLALEKLLKYLMWQVEQTQLTTTSNLTKIDTALTRLARSAIEPFQVSPEIPMQLSEAQFQEFARQAGGFAVEVHTLSQRLTIILQEMRTSIVPFALEGEANANQATKSTTGSPAPEAFAAAAPSTAKKAPL